MPLCALALIPHRSPLLSAMHCSQSSDERGRDSMPKSWHPSGVLQTLPPLIGCASLRLCLGIQVAADLL